MSAYDDVEEFWSAILSEDAALVLGAWSTLDAEERGDVEAHLARMSDPTESYADGQQRSPASRSTPSAIAERGVPAYAAAPLGRTSAPSVAVRRRLRRSRRDCGRALARRGYADRLLAASLATHPASTQPLLDGARTWFPPTRRGSMRRLILVGVSCLAWVGCGSHAQSGTGGNGDGYIFDPCVSDPAPGYDPKSRDLDACCDDGPAHCVPDESGAAGAGVEPDRVQRRQERLHARSDHRSGRRLRAGGVHLVGGQRGRRLPVEVHPAGLGQSAVGAARPGWLRRRRIVRAVHQPDVAGADGRVRDQPDAVRGRRRRHQRRQRRWRHVSVRRAAAARSRRRSTRARRRAAARTACRRRACPRRSRACSTSARPRAASPGLCAPDKLIATGGNFVPRVVHLGRRRRGALPVELSAVGGGGGGAAAARRLRRRREVRALLQPDRRRSDGPDGRVHARVRSRRAAADGAELPVDRAAGRRSATFPACDGACSDAHCVPTANVPAAEQALLTGVHGRLLRARSADRVGRRVRAQVVHVDRRRRGALPVDLPAADRGRGGAAAGRRLRRGREVRALLQPDGRRSDGADGRVHARRATSRPSRRWCSMCPWSGPPVVDPTTFPSCSPSCGGAHCVPSAMVPAAEQALLATCPGGFCAPDPIISTAGNYVPPTCAAFTGTPAEGRCMSTCIPSVEAQASELHQHSCASGTLCAPCYDPFSGADTGACHVGCDKPKNAPYKFPLCCSSQGTCVPTENIPSERGLEPQPGRLSVEPASVRAQGDAAGRTGPASVHGPARRRGALLLRLLEPRARADLPAARLPQQPHLRALLGQGVQLAGAIASLLRSLH